MEWVNHPPLFSIYCNPQQTQRVYIPVLFYAPICGIEGHPMKAVAQWEADLGLITGEHWETALQAINTYSLNVMQKVSQLYILLRAHYTPVKLHKMGKLPDSLCGKCKIVPSDLIHLLWHCPKLHRYWRGSWPSLTRYLKPVFLLIHVVAF